MNQNLRTSGRGFTIIEVVLVLAIAALIFLLVFLAVPALQRNQRDTQRKSDIGRFISQIQNYQSANKGSVPADSLAALGPNGSFTSAYMTTGGDTWADPSTGNTYQWVNSTPDENGEFQYQQDATCNGEQIASGGGNRKVAIQIKLEGAGHYCVSN